MDASSTYQDSLPVSSDALLAMLKERGFDFRLYEHVPLRTVEDAKAVEDQIIASGEKALRLKNLYLRDRKKRNYLMSLEQDRAIDLKALGRDIGAGGLSFGSPDRLMEHLGIRPGAVSPLAMITGVERGVTFYLDAAAKDVDAIYMHPLVNDRTIAVRRDDLFDFLEQIGCVIHWIE